MARPTRLTPPNPAPPKPPDSEDGIEAAGADAVDTGGQPDVSPQTGPGAPPGTPSPRRHKIRRGDTLWSIAQKVYGDPERWPDIARANPQHDPNRLQIGAVLRLP